MTPTYPPQHVRAALLNARLAAQKRHSAAAEYRQALQHAHHAGCTYTELATVLGITRQAVRQTIITS